MKAKTTVKVDIDAEVHRKARVVLAMRGQTVADFVRQSFEKLAKKAPATVPGGETEDQRE